MTSGRRAHLGRIVFAAGLLVAGACVHRAGVSAAPPSPRGRWAGEMRFPDDLPLLVEISIDSTAAGWSGALRTPPLGEEPVPFAAVTRAGDSVVLQLPASAQGLALRARLSPDGRRLDGLIDGSAHGALRAARSGTADADSVTAESRRVDDSRRRAATMVDTVPATPQPDPDAARLVTSDIGLFWDAVDAAPRDSLGAYLQRGYLERGSVGVRDFIPGRILSAEDLAAYVLANRARYDSSRAAKLDVTRADSAIRAAFRRLKQLYPDAVYPDVYFVVGRFNSGGTSSRHGLLIGSEKYRDAAQLPPLVAHELIHYQQRCDAPTLLQHSLMEGSADFVGELISGRQINNAAHEYGLAHEHELWTEFTPHSADTTSFYPWMYGKPKDGRPNDLGYFIGYRIAQAYYQRAADKSQAVRDIIAACRADGKDFVARSGYAP